MTSISLSPPMKQGKKICDSSQHAHNKLFHIHSSTILFHTSEPDIIQEIFISGKCSHPLIDCIHIVRLSSITLIYLFKDGVFVASTPLWIHMYIIVNNNNNKAFLNSIPDGSSFMNMNVKWGRLPIGVP